MWPDWAWKVLMLSGFLFVANFFINAATLGSTSTDPIDFIIDLATFNVPGIPDWLSWLLFTISTLPLLLLLFASIAPLLSNAVTGAVVGILVLTGAVLVAVNYLF